MMFILTALLTFFLTLKDGFIVTSVRQPEAEKTVEARWSEETAPVVAALPKTASSLPAILLIGCVSLLLGLGLRRLRQYQHLF